MIAYFVEHRHDVVVRRTKYDLRKAEERAHILEGCLLYTSDAADERSSVDLGGRRIIKKKKQLDY